MYIYFVLFFPLLAMTNNVAMNITIKDFCEDIDVQLLKYMLKNEDHLYLKINATIKT